jgi:hypothetical protein
VHVCLHYAAATVLRFECGLYAGALARINAFVSWSP